MIIVKIQGGIGNQMFQYAFGRSLAEKRGEVLKLDLSFFFESGWLRRETPRKYALKQFNIDAEVASEDEIARAVGRVFYRLPAPVKRILVEKLGINKKKYFFERTYAFDPQIFATSEGNYFDGYWNTEKYFLEISDLIRKEFNLKNDLWPDDGGVTRSICQSESVSIHVRRGDFANDKKTNQFHGLCGNDYYQKAIKYIASQIADPRFFVFSDEVEWARNNIRCDYPTIFVSQKGFKDCQELMLMSYCKHNIIANSSFSWWAAWRNRNPGKIIIAPKKWVSDKGLDTSDIIPGGWLRL